MEIASWRGIAKWRATRGRGLIPFLNQKLHCRLRLAVLQHCLRLAFAYFLIWKWNYAVFAVVLKPIQNLAMRATVSKNSAKSTGFSTYALAASS